MIKKKVCMVGSFAVGKTSLVAQFVSSIFSEKYHTTLGVKIDKKNVSPNGTDVNLILWDLAGDDEFQPLNLSYIKGSSGYMLVCDGTRKISLDKALELKERIEATLGVLPFCLLINKHDLIDQWEISPNDIDILKAKNWTVYMTSAKSGAHVEEAFHHLAKQTLHV